MPFPTAAFRHFLLSVLVLSSSAVDHNRHVLHQPLFPSIPAVPSSEPPSSTDHRSHKHHHHHRRDLPPPPQEKQTSSSAVNPHAPPPHNPFFPSSSPTSSAHPPLPSSLPTFPANISAIPLQNPNRNFESRRSHHVMKIVAITASVVSAALLISLLALVLIFLRRRRSGAPVDDSKSTRSDSLRLLNSSPSAASLKHKQPMKHTSTDTNSEFLYLGTLVNSRSGGSNQQSAAVSRNVVGVAGGQCSASSSSQYQKMGSPELLPLPPLPKHPSSEQINPKSHEDDGDDNDNEEFFSPRGSSGRKPSPTHVLSSWRREFQGIGADQFGSTSFNSRTASYPYSNTCSPTDSMVSSSTSPTSLKPKSPDSSMKSAAQPHMYNPFLSSIPSSSSGFISKQSGGVSHESKKQPPHPLPPPPFSEIPAFSSKDEEEIEIKNDTVKPMLNDGFLFSCRLNEKMIETQFGVNDPTFKPKDIICVRSNQLIDPKKAETIAILMRSLNVTTDEVCNAVSEGNSDTLGLQLLEGLLAMSPTKEEEDRLKDLTEDESLSKLGPDETFLKQLLHIPFAFQRIQAMLYIVNFESEAEYLKRSFDAIDAACEELKNTQIFQKLLEEVLKAGSRLNVGNNRGDAHELKLDMLLKLLHIKGTDGETTLLHFVVQEIIKYVGSHECDPGPMPESENQTEETIVQDDLELRKLDLEMVSGLGAQMMNVKKAALMDAVALINGITDVSMGLAKVKEIAELNQEIGVNTSGCRFSESMNVFLSKADKEMAEIQARGSNALTRVKEVTEYFNGDSEGHSIWIFAVIRDFLGIIDLVCKEVGMMKERTVYRSVHLLPALNRQQSQSGSSDKEFAQ